MKDASSTDVVVHAGRALTSFYQCGDLYALDPVTLAPLGRETWGGRFPSAVGVSAHTKLDEHTGYENVYIIVSEKPISEADSEVGALVKDIRGGKLPAVPSNGG